MEFIYNLQEIVRVVEIAAIIAVLISISYLASTLSKYMKLRESRLNLEIGYAKFIKENEKQSTKYSKEILELIRKVIAQIAILKFRTFRDRHADKINLVTQSNIESLAGDVAESVYKSLNPEVLTFKDTFFTKEFYESFIVETSILMVKDLWAKTLKEIDEKDGLQ